MSKRKKPSALSNDEVKMLAELLAKHNASTAAVYLFNYNCEKLIISQGSLVEVKEEKEPALKKPKKENSAKVSKDGICTLFYW